MIRGVMCVHCSFQIDLLPFAVPPVVGRGSGGRVGASATHSLVQSLVDDSMRDQDVSLVISGARAELTLTLFSLAASRSSPQVRDCRCQRQRVDSCMDQEPAKGESSSFRLRSSSKADLSRCRRPSSTLGRNQKTQRRSEMLRYCLLCCNSAVAGS